MRPLEKTRCQFELDHSQGRDFPEGMFLNDQFDQRVRELGFSNRGVNDILERNPLSLHHNLRRRRSFGIPSG